MRATVSFIQLPHAAGLPAPAYQTDCAAGLDLLAALSEGEALTLPPGGRGLIPTGLKLAIPPGYEGQVRPRSGLALKSGVTVLNSPGTIDVDYRGELGVILANFGAAPFEVRRGDRIAQLVFMPIMTVELVAVADLDTTERGAGGFGSTGTSGAKL